MKPLFFPGHNRILTGPQGLLDEEIIPLPALVGSGLVTPLACAYGWILQRLGIGQDGKGGGG